MTRLRIMLVDDNPTVSALLAELLDVMGHEVCSIETTETGAVAAALRVRPDLMIVDAYLEQGSGLSAIDTVLRTTPMPHIFMSGSRLALQKIASTVLYKPFMADELACAIAEAAPGPANPPFC